MSAAITAKPNPKRVFLFWSSFTAAKRPIIAEARTEPDGTKPSTNTAGFVTLLWPFILAEEPVQEGKTERFIGFIPLAEIQTVKRFPMRIDAWCPVDSPVLLKGYQDIQRQASYTDAGLVTP
jgi:hypothetical protein